MDLHLVILSAGAALEVVSSDRRQLLFMVLLFLAFPDLFLSFPAAVLGTKAGGMWHTCPSHSSPVGLLLPRCTSLPSTCSSSFEMVLGQKIVKGFFLLDRVNASPICVQPTSFLIRAWDQQWRSSLFAYSF